MPYKVVRISTDDEGQRLDRWLRRNYPGLTQSFIQKALRKGDIRINNQKTEANYRLQKEDEVNLLKIKTADISSKPIKKLLKHKIDLKSLILYQDDHIFVLNKPQGLAVQGGTKIEEALTDFLDQLQFDAKEIPRLVHRLDKETSGLLILARTLKASHFYTTILRDKKLHKIYWAITIGIPPQKSGIIKASLYKDISTRYEKIVISEEKGKIAETAYRVLQAKDNFALLELEPKTGRTHQLRVHCANYGFPVLGDGKYGGKEAQPKITDTRPTLHLHAKQLILPLINGKTIDLTAPLPDHMKKTFDSIGFRRKND